MHRITERPPESVADIVREGCKALGCDDPGAGIPMELLQPLIWTLAHEVDSLRQELEAAQSGLASLAWTVETVNHPEEAGS